MNRSPFHRPHTRAAQLVEARLDGEVLTPSDARWLDDHLSACPVCARRAGQTERLLGLLRNQPAHRAPEGFAGRVVEAARVAVGPEVEPIPHRPRWVGAAAFAVAAAAVVAMWVGPGGPARDDLRIGATAAMADERPHFVVRAPSLGGARLRQRAERLVRAHEGRSTLQQGALRAVIPRQALVGVLAELERAGAVELQLVREPAHDERQVILRFELD